MPLSSQRRRIGRIALYPPLFLLGLLILVYNPISVRLMTVGTAVVYKLDSQIFYRLIQAESRFRSCAVSPNSAIGLGQVKESTARYIHVKYRRGMLFVPFYNLKISARYLSYLREQFAGNWTLVLAAYNWGESNVALRMRGVRIDPAADYRERFSDVPETYHYINKILPPVKKA